MKITLFFVATALLINWLCNHNDKEIPTCVLESPSDGTNFKKGYIIFIKGSISDNTALKQVHIHLETASGIELIHIEKDVNQNTFAFNTSYTIPNTVHTNLNLEIEAYDQSNNHLVKTVSLSQN